MNDKHYQCVGCKKEFKGKNKLTHEGRPICSATCKKAIKARQKKSADEIHEKYKKIMKRNGLSTRTPKNPNIMSVKQAQAHWAKQAQKERKAQKTDKRVPVVRDVSPKRKGLLGLIFG